MTPAPPRARRVSDGNANGCASLYVERRNVFIGAREPMTAAPLDISEIKAHHTYDEVNGTASLHRAIHNERGALLAEVERLQAEAASFEAQVDALMEIAVVDRAAAVRTAYEDAAKVAAEFKPDIGETAADVESPNKYTNASAVFRRDQAIAAAIRALAAKNGAVR